MSLLDRRRFLTGSAKAAGALMVAGSTRAFASGPASPYICGISLFGGDTPPIDVSGTLSGTSNVYPDGFRVRAGTTLTLDPNVSTTITVGGNVVVEGTLRMRPANRDIIHKLVFTGVNESAYVGGGTVPLSTDVGLWAVEAGRLDLRGTEKVAWNRTGWDSSWKSSDEVRIAPTAEGDIGSNGFALFNQGDSVPGVEFGVPLPASLTFSDTFNFAHRDNIEALAASGITQGCEDGRFCPRDIVTRGQMAAFLRRAMNLPAAGSAGFVDTIGHTFEDDINRLFARGITNGCDATHFCPDDPVTRGQMAAFISRALEYPSAPSAGFTDTRGHTFEDEINRLAFQGVTLGRSDGSYGPDEYVSREQMASFLARAFDLPIPESSAETNISAEVLNLTRNVKIEGTPGGKAHIFIRSSEISTIEYVEIRHMGPRPPAGNVDDIDGVLGRYGLHFHANFEDTRGTVVKGTVIAETGFHAFVPHLSNGITFEDCISYDTADQAYWWDTPLQGAGNPDESHDVVYDNCVAAYAHRESQGHRLGGFMLGAGDGSVAVNCVAVGIQNGGYGYHWPETSQGVWGFHNCVGHNNKGAGIFVWQNTGNIHEIHGFLAYHNAKSGIEHGAYVNSYIFNNCLLYMNGEEGMLFHAGSRSGADKLTLSNSTVIGPNPLASTQHNGVPIAGYTQIVNCDLRSTNGRVMFIDGTNFDDLYQVRDCTLSGGTEVVFGPSVTSSSRIEIIENGSIVSVYTP